MIRAIELEPRTFVVQRHCPSSGELSTLRVGRALRLQLVGRRGPYARRRYELWVGEARVSREGARTSADGWIREWLPDASAAVLKVYFDPGEIPETYHLDLVHHEAERP